MPKQMMTDDNMEKLIAYRELDSSCVFADDGDGFLSLTLDETVYRPVDLIRLLPYDRPDEYISCVCKEQELGIIRRIADFSEEQQRILQHQLSFRYYTPVIEKIISVREKMWFVFIKVVVDGQKKEALHTGFISQYSVLQQYRSSFDRCGRKPVSDSKFSATACKNAAENRNLPLINHKNRGGKLWN